MPTILVVDDSLSVRKVAERILREAGLDVALAANGEDAMAWLSGNQPDLVIADVIMPDKSGFEVCAFVRAQANLARTPVLLISGFVDDEVTRQAEACRADGVVKKPFQGMSLRERVVALLAARKEQEALAPAPEIEMPEVAPEPELALAMEAPPPVPAAAPELVIEMPSAAAPEPELTLAMEAPPPVPAAAPELEIEAPSAVAPEPELTLAMEAPPPVPAAAPELAIVMPAVAASKPELMPAAAPAPTVPTAALELTIKMPVIATPAPELMPAAAPPPPAPLAASAPASHLEDEVRALLAATQGLDARLAEQEKGRGQLERQLQSFRESTTQSFREISAGDQLEVLRKRLAEQEHRLAQMENQTAELRDRVAALEPAAESAKQLIQTLVEFARHALKPGEGGDR